MAVVKEGQAPYAPAPAVMQVLHGYRTKHPETPFTTDNLQLLGVSASLAPRTLQSLQLLDLVDSDGEPTDAMRALREAESDDFPARLADVLRAAYSEVFRYRDPATDSPDKLREVFRFYRPPSMQDRMLRLFYGLCAEANIISEAPAIANANGNGSSQSPTPKRERKPSRGPNKSTAQTPPPPPPPRPSVAKKELPELVAALVAKLPAKGESWTAEDAAWWLQVAEMSFPREYGFQTPTKEDK